MAGLSLKDIDRALLGLRADAQPAAGASSRTPTAPETRVAVMQRKQNLGMNAILSVSLALARAIAHVQGKELYELLREEMLAIIDDLAREYHVEVDGSRFIDYVTALRKVNGILEGQGGRCTRSFANTPGSTPSPKRGRPGKASPNPGRHSPPWWMRSVSRRK